jgi:Protein of unknown function (DUF2939)
MRGRWPVLAVLVALGAAYVVYPYATLWRLDTAVRRSDAVTLSSLVDWYAVREGLKEDICDMAMDDPDATHTDNALPPFGAGFVRGITGTRLDKAVTPETLVLMTQAGRDVPREQTRVVWAFFHDPIRFDIDLRANGSPEPIRMVMELRGMRWQVRRVWLPNEWLERAGSGT